MYTVVLYISSFKALIVTSMCDQSNQNGKNRLKSGHLTVIIRREIDFRSIGIGLFATSTFEKH